MSESDLDQVLEIERSSFGSPWRREHFVFEILENPWAINHVVRRGKEVLAYACLWIVDDELKINNVAVRRDVRRRGLGSWVVGHILRQAASRGCSVVNLEVRPSNEPALRLYRRFGFVKVGRRKDYYRREGEDAILMEARLP